MEFHGGYMVEDKDSSIEPAIATFSHYGWFRNTSAFASSWIVGWIFERFS